MAKKCDVSRNCYWGDAFHPGYCAYSEEMKEDAVCPKLVDRWDAAPVNVMEDLIMKARMKDV